MTSIEGRRPGRYRLGRFRVELLLIPPFPVLTPSLNKKTQDVHQYSSPHMSNLSPASSVSLSAASVGPFSGVTAVVSISGSGL